MGENRLCQVQGVLGFSKRGRCRRCIRVGPPLRELSDEMNVGDDHERTPNLRVWYLFEATFRLPFFAATENKRKVIVCFKGFLEGFG